MAAASVLERRLNALEHKTNPTTENPEEIQHNALIKQNYERLMDRTLSVNALMGREEEVDDSSAQKFNQSEYYKANPREALFGNRAGAVPVVNNDAPVNSAPVVAQPYRQTYQQDNYAVNPIADADVFRADSPLNQRYFAEQPTLDVGYENDEESEDLRPTRATIQYGSAERVNNENIPSSTVSENEDSRARVTLGKREKIIIGAFISMVVALFVMVIINSAIISRLNSDVSSAEQSLADIENEYAQVYESVRDASGAASVYEYAQNNDMVFVGTED